jgi:ribosomal protein L16/L10AE
MTDNKFVKSEAVKTAKDVLAESKTQKSFGTTTMFENVFASMWLEFPIEQLEAQRMLLNKIIKERKEKMRIIQHEHSKITQTSAESKQQ